MNSFFKWFLSLFERGIDYANTDVELPKEEEKQEVKEEESIMSKYERLDKPYRLSKSGEERLNQCCKDIQTVIREVLYYRDISILCGYRSNEEQEMMYKQKTSKARAGQSAHNYKPSLAIDVVPYPIPKKNDAWDSDSEEWQKLCDLIMDIAKDKGIELEWGGNWKSLVDKPHYEIKDWKNKK